MNMHASYTSSVHNISKQGLPRCGHSLFLRSAADLDSQLLIRRHASPGGTEAAGAQVARLRQGAAVAAALFCSAPAAAAAAAAPMSAAAAGEDAPVPTAVGGQAAGPAAWVLPVPACRVATQRARRALLSERLHRSHSPELHKFSLNKYTSAI
jgi:hypothetical protein